MNLLIRNYFWTAPIARAGRIIRGWFSDGLGPNQRREARQSTSRPKHLTFCDLCGRPYTLHLMDQSGCGLGCYSVQPDPPVVGDVLCLENNANFVVRWSTSILDNCHRLGLEVIL